MSRLTLFAKNNPQMRNIAINSARRHTSRRYLHTFVKPRPEVAIVNNSGLMFTRAAYQVHGHDKHPLLKVLKQGMWLDNTHSDYDQLKWGQSPAVLPKYARSDFLKIYPNHPMDEAITWKQMKDLREYTTDFMVRTMGIEVLEEMPKIELLDDSSIKLDTSRGIEILAPDTHFYISARQPRLLHGLSTQPGVSHTELYTMPRTEIPENIAILGGGRSAIWTAQHFPESQVFAISNEESLSLLPGEEVPKNLTLITPKMLSNGEYQVDVLDREQQMAIITHRNAPVYAGPMHCAIGLEQMSFPFEAWVDPSNITRFDNQILGDWVAPDTALRGSLIEATSRWAITTGNYEWASEASAFHVHNSVQPVVSALQEQGFTTNAVFYDTLREEITKLGNDATEDKVTGAYIKALQANSVSPLSESKIEAAKAVIKEFSKAPELQTPSVGLSM